MLTTDQIEITALHLRAIIGIKPDERQKHQDILINITLDIDTRPAALSDDIADAVNYRTITKSVINLVENSRFFLVEKLATAVAQVCLEEQRVQKVRVSVEKPSALRFAASVGVTIERSQNEL